MKSQIRFVNDHGNKYICLGFVCPGCVEMFDERTSTGLHLLPIKTPTSTKEPAWEWNWNTITPTLSPSILTGKDSPDICHSFLKEGIFEFLSDCTHSLVGQKVPIPDLPDWFVREGEE